MADAFISKTPYQTNNTARIYKIAVWAIIIIGISLRLFHYFNNRSLWEDEIYLSTGIERLSLSDLFKYPLDFQQKAPIGYLVIVKSITLLFGGQEMALRLFPLLCSIASLFCFLPVSRYFLKPVGVIVAMALLAFAPPLVYHSVEAKQYATELFATILVALLYIRYHHLAGVRPLFWWGILGAVIVWFSYSSVFILAGVAFTMCLYCLIRKDMRLFQKLLLPFMLWFGSFAVNYILFTQKDAHTGWLVFFFVKHNAFMPLSGGMAKWILHHILAFFNYPLGLSWFTIYNNPSILRQILMRMVIVPLFFSVAGIVYLYKTNKKLLCFIASTFIIVVIASAIKLYPFTERLVVFLAPLAILLLAAGCEALFVKKSSFPVCKAALIFMLLFGPVKNIIEQTANPYLFGDYKKSYQREALLYLNSKYQPGDVVYVYWNDLPGYRMYKKMYNLKYSAIEGNDYRHKTTSFPTYFTMLDGDIKPLMKNKRVWIIQNNYIDIPIGDYIGDPAWYYQNSDGPKRFHDYIRQQGKVSDEYKPTDNSAASDIGVALFN